jgi:hypothetical protein
MKVVLAAGCCSHDSMSSISALGEKTRLEYECVEILALMTE